ncbi:MAG: sodium:proton antiporter [Woeseiaceae bacterium]|nr:sodium:proton antiporter [Woeseiaceae bacterium]
MYEELAILAVYVFIYSIIAGRIERGFFSGPIVFVASGIIFGPLVLGLFDLQITTRELRILADLTLALVLFVDAANADLSTLKRHIKIPSRMLLIGLPGVILLGFGFAVLLFDGLSLFEAAILATMLAATDAALGKAVITNKSVPIHVREGLNAESGLNDGLCVPVLFVFIALAEGVNAHGSGMSLALTLVAEELGIGLLVGIGLSAIAAPLLKACWQRGWVTEVWVQVTIIALAIACFAVAQSMHGSGYIAAFTGGLLFGHLAKDSTHKLVLAAEGDAETLAMLTWLVFGAAVVGQFADLITWQVIGYSVLSLTLIRVMPIFLSLVGSGEPVASRLFLGWFGPRGLASIVFAIIVINKDLPGGKLMAMVVACTVILSLVAHGITARPLANWLVRKVGTTAEQD